jgi:hypothetical protein
VEIRKIEMNWGTFVNERITLTVFEFSVFRMSAFDFKFPCPVKCEANYFTGDWPVKSFGPWNPFQIPPDCL